MSQHPASGNPGLVALVRAAAHRLAQGAGPEVAGGQEDGTGLPEVEESGVGLEDWLPYYTRTFPPQALFPGDYSVLLQPFFVTHEESGVEDPEGRPVDYLVGFVTGLVSQSSSLPADGLGGAVQEALRQVMVLARDHSQAHEDRTVRLLLARMPGWMGRRLLPGVGSRPVPSPAGGPAAGAPGSAPRAGSRSPRVQRRPRSRTKGTPRGTARRSP